MNIHFLPKAYHTLLGLRTLHSTSASHLVAILNCKISNKKNTEIAKALMLKHPRKGHSFTA
jgi:hypothetical protein